MFDLDRAIHQYMRTVVDRRLINRGCADEIESHLRDDIDDLVAHGIDAQAAFAQATVSMGHANSLRGEFNKLYGHSRWAQTANVLSYYFDRRFMMRVAFGFLLGLFFILGGLILEGGHLGSIIQVTAGFIAVGGGLGALVIGYPLKVVLKSFVLAITGREAERSAYLNAANVFRTFGDLCVLSGFVGTMFGLIHVCENMDKGFQYLGPGLAVAVVSLLYGILVKLFLGKPLFDSFMARANPEGDSSDPRSGFDKRMAA